MLFHKKCPNFQVKIHLWSTPFKVNLRTNYMIINGSRDCACTDHMADHALITWLIMH